MGQIKFIGSLLLFALFGLSIIVFAANFANDNNAAFSINDIDDFNSSATQVITNLSSYQTRVINASDAFYKSEIQEGETVRTGGQFKLGPATALATTTTLISAGFKSIFGSGNAFGVILTTLVAFLGFVLIMLIWKTWGGRNPE